MLTHLLSLQDSCTGNVCFDKVRFAYPSWSDVKVLQGLDLSVTTGKTLALVGASGCGKRTTVGLLERFYDPESGMTVSSQYSIISFS